MVGWVNGAMKILPQKAMGRRERTEESRIMGKRERKCYRLNEEVERKWCHQNEEVERK